MLLILASGSSRRQELLRNAGFTFEVRPSSIPEEPRPDETPEAFVQRMAAEKALDVAARSPAGTLVLGADTVVVVGAEILNKPGNSEEAARILRELSGRSHRVLTGVCLVKAPRTIEARGESDTRVWFRPLAEDEIRDYVATGEPLDKAGAYGIQGRASRFVTRIEGCYFNVVGLPVALVDEMLRPFLGTRQH